MQLGVEKNDVVSCQLPNWWQFTALTLACGRIGAVINPMMPIFREREVKFMLGLAQSKIFVVPREFRAFDYPEMVRSKPGIARLAPPSCNWRRRGGKLREVFARSKTDNGQGGKCPIHNAPADRR